MNEEGSVQKLNSLNDLRDWMAEMSSTREEPPTLELLTESFKEWRPNAKSDMSMLIELVWLAGKCSTPRSAKSWKRIGFAGMDRETEMEVETLPRTGKVRFALQIEERQRGLPYAQPEEVEAELRRQMDARVRFVLADGRRYSIKIDTRCKWNEENKRGRTVLVASLEGSVYLLDPREADIGEEVPLSFCPQATYHRTQEDGSIGYFACADDGKSFRKRENSWECVPRWES